MKFTLAMLYQAKVIFFIGLIGLLLSARNAGAQIQRHGKNDTLLLGAVVEHGDTIAVVFLPDVLKIDKMPRRLARQMAYDAQLKYNVYKTYPYACAAADILKDVDVNLAKLDDKRERKQYLKSIEKQLNARFKGELEDLTITQGQILVRLIDRQTGKNCYSIIKELKGGFSAVIWQSVALIFSNNLKKEYDGADRDHEIEGIVKELEASNYYKYKLYQQQLNLQAKK